MLCPVALVLLLLLLLLLLRLFTFPMGELHPLIAGGGAGCRPAAVGATTRAGAWDWFC
jgi:hypothetical protein